METDGNPELKGISTTKYYGMNASPCEMYGGRCKGLTNAMQPCKRKATPHSHYCKAHEDIYKYDHPSECPICYEGFTSKVKPTKCGHYMHKKCLETWLVDHVHCPICRTTLRVPKVQLKLEIEQGATVHFEMVQRAFVQLMEQLGIVGS